MFTARMDPCFRRDNVSGGDDVDSSVWVSPTHNKFKCPVCPGKGSSVRGFQPKFKTLHKNEGRVSTLFRVSLMRCKSCGLYYSVNEINREDSWYFVSYQDVETYQALEADTTAPVYLGSTASEWTKRQAKGVKF